MKRLLLPLLATIALPTAVNANLYNRDFVVETDVGEKYIVKKNGIQEIDDLKFLNFFINFLSGDYSRFVLDLISNKKNIDATSQLDRYKDKFRNLWFGSNHFGHVKILEFRTVFEDLNSYKTASDYKKLICFNPALNSAQTKAWKKDFFKNYDYDFVNKDSSLALDALNIKICNSVKFDSLKGIEKARTQKKVWEQIDKLLNERACQWMNADKRIRWCW